MIKTDNYLLFCPGPINVALNVKEATVGHDIGHREFEFEKLFKRLQNRILDVFEVQNKKEFLPIVITGSGSAANESILSSIVGNKHILTLSNGEFGERLYNISKLHNANTSTIRQEWGKEIDVAAVKAYLSTHKVDIIAMVHHETCSGMLNPVAKIGALTKKYGITFMLDAVSSAGAEKIDLEKWNIAFCSTSASKALSSLSGLSLVIGRKKEFAKIKNLPKKTMYLNLYSFYDYAKRLKQTPNTPGVPLFFALDQAIANILAIGVAKKRAQIKSHARALRTGMTEMGLKFLLDENVMSSSITTVFVPRNVSTSALKANLRKRNIIIYEGKGVFKNKVFQVANIGEITKDQVQYFLGELKTAMALSTITAITKKSAAKKVTPLKGATEVPSHRPFFPQIFSLSMVRNRNTPSK